MARCPRFCEDFFHRLRKNHDNQSQALCWFQANSRKIIATPTGCCDDFKQFRLQNMTACVRGCEDFLPRLSLQIQYAWGSIMGINLVWFKFFVPEIFFSSFHVWGEIWEPLRQCWLRILATPTRCCLDLIHLQGLEHGNMRPTLSCSNPQSIQNLRSSSPRELNQKTCSKMAFFRKP